MEAPTAVREADRSSAAALSMPRQRGLLFIPFVMVLVAVLVRTAWMSDDAMITLRTVLNLTHGHGLTYNIGERVQTFTHPAWLALLTALYVVVGNVYFAAFAISIATSVAAFLLALSRSVSTTQVWLTATVLLLSRAWIDFATSGLENPLACVLLAVFVGVFFNNHLEASPRRWLTYQVGVASLLYLTRPDAVLLVVPLVMLAVYRTRAVSIVVPSVALGSLPAVLWTAFALVYYGFPFPNTAYAKLGGGISQRELWRQGGLYFFDSFDRDPLTLVAVGWALLWAAVRGSAATRALALGIAAYLVFVARIGGDFMSGRFFAVPLFAAVLVLNGVRNLGRGVWLTTIAAAVALGLASDQIPLLSDSRFQGSERNTRNGIVDERAFYFQKQALVRAGRSSFTEPDWGGTGPAPGANRYVLDTCGLMGASGLEFGPFAYMLDMCALADPLLARMPAMYREEWRPGHLTRYLPDGYRESLTKSANHVRDPKLRVFYEHLRLVTRGPNLFRWRRLRTIALMNAGSYDALVDIDYYFYFGRPPVSLDAVAVVRADGTAGDAPGTVTLNEPLVVRCDDKPGRRYLDASLDSDDRYLFTFLKHREKVASLEIDPIPMHRRVPGLVSRTFDLPARATLSGFDTIVVVPLAGDDRYSLGHLLVDGHPPTEPELMRRVASRDRPPT